MNCDDNNLISKYEISYIGESRYAFFQRENTSNADNLKFLNIIAKWCKSSFENEYENWNIIVYEPYGTCVSFNQKDCITLPNSNDELFFKLQWCN